MGNEPKEDPGNLTKSRAVYTAAISKTKDIKIVK